MRPRGPVTVTFAVEQDLKGNLGDEVKLRTSSQGSSCGLEVAEDERVGLFLSLDGDRWTSSLCQQIDPSLLLRAARPLPAPNGRGPVRFLVGGNFGEARVLALDARGRTLAYGWGQGGVFQLQVCPGGQRAVESVRDSDIGSLVVRDVATLAVVRRFDLVRAQIPVIYAVACLDVEGDHLLAIVQARGEVQIHEIVDGKAQVVFARHGRGSDASIVDGVPYLVSDRELGHVDVATGTWTPIVRLPRYVSRPRVSPDGRWVAGVRYGDSLPGDPPSDVVVIPTGGGTVRSIPMVGWNDFGAVRWLSPDRLLFLPAGEAVDRLAIYDVPSLQEVVGADDWYATESVIVDGTIYGVGSGGLIQVQLGEDGRARPFHRLFGEVFALDDVPGEISAEPSPAPPTQT